MKLVTGRTVLPNRSGLPLHALRSAFAVLAIGCTFYAHDSSAVLVLANDQIELDWYVGQTAPSIDFSSPSFVVMGCGAELAWVYQNYPTIAMRTLPAAPPAPKHKAVAVAGAPAESVCVIWRGETAVFIADNLDVTLN